MPSVRKFLDHWKFDKVEFVLARVSLAIGHKARLVIIIIIIVYDEEESGSVRDK